MAKIREKIFRSARNGGNSFVRRRENSLLEGVRFLIKGNQYIRQTHIVGKQTEHLIRATERYICDEDVYMKNKLDFTRYEQPCCTNQLKIQFSQSLIKSFR